MCIRDRDKENKLSPDVIDGILCEEKKKEDRDAVSYTHLVADVYIIIAITSITEDKRGRKKKNFSAFIVDKGTPCLLYTSVFKTWNWQKASGASQDICAHAA